MVVDDYEIPELSRDIFDKAVLFLENEIPKAVKAEVRYLYNLDSKTWWANNHHGWGTGVRNSLRSNVCTDDKLPTRNWDDYYIPCVEKACRCGEKTE